MLLLEVKLGNVIFFLGRQASCWSQDCWLYSHKCSNGSFDRNSCSPRSSCKYWLLTYIISKHIFSSNRSLINSMLIYFISGALGSLQYLLFSEWSSCCIGRKHDQCVCLERREWRRFLVVHRKVYKRWKLAAKYGARWWRRCNSPSCKEI